MKLKIFTDGGSRGNPGPGATGFVIYQIDVNGKKKKIVSYGEKIGTCTNNTAEYKAIISALEWVIKNIQALPDKPEINFHLDSLLVASQLSGLYKIKDANLRNLLITVRNLEGMTGGSISYEHIPREKNREADLEVNKAMDF